MNPLFFSRSIPVLFCVLFSFISTAQTLYWVGGSGNFHDRNHWSFVSGGAPGSDVPAESMDIVFDDNSGNGLVKITFGSFSRVKSITTTNTANMLEFSSIVTSTLCIHGSVDLNKNIYFTITGLILFDSESDQANEIDLGPGVLSTDVFFNKGIYNIFSLKVADSKTLRFGTGEYVFQNSIVSAGNFINESPLTKFNVNNSYFKVVNKFVIETEQEIKTEGLYVVADISNPANYTVPGSLSSSKQYTSVNIANVVCPVTITTAPACNGLCTGVLTVSLSPSCTNTPYSVLLTSVNCTASAAALSNTSIPSVYTVTNACACPSSNYVLIVRDGSNTIQTIVPNINFTPNQPVLFDNNINTGCGSACGGVLQGVIFGTVPFSVSVVSSSASVASFTTASGNYTVPGICAGTYSFLITDGAGCLSSITRSINSSISPVIMASSGTICAGNVFDLAPAGGISYTITGGTATVSPTVTTNYTVTGSNGGCSGSVVATVSVSSSPTISVSDGTICSGSTYTINPSGAVSYTFLPGNSSIINPGTTSSYSVSGNSSNGCIATKIITITVNPLPVISVNSGTVCSGTAFTLTPSGAATYSYSGVAPIVTPTASTVYSITGTSAQGCVSSTTAISNVTVLPLPSVTTNSGTICAGGSFSMVASGAQTYTFSTSNPIQGLTATSFYTVTGTGTNGCNSGASGLVTVLPAPTITAANGTICAGQSFSIVPSGAVSYSYSGGNALVSPTVSSIYSVTGTGVNGCSSLAPFVVSVSVNSLPNISVNSGSICAGQSFTFFPTGAATYSYSSGSNSITPLTSGSYSVTGTSSLGCVSASVTISSVTVNPLPVISVSDGTICKGASFTISPSGVSSFSITGGTAIVSPTINSTYSVTGTTSLGCVSTIPTSVHVIVATSPLPVFSSNNPCEGQALTFTTAAGAVSYLWNGPVGFLTTAQNPVIPVSTLMNSGIYTLTTAFNTLNITCTAAIASGVTVNPLPFITATGGTICQGQAFVIIPSGGISYSYSGGSATVNPSATSNYIVIGVGANGCINTAQLTVSVNPLPVISPVSAVLLLCFGEASTLTASGATSYSWSTGVLSNSIIVNPMATTLYTVSGININGCSGSAVITQSVDLCLSVDKVKEDWQLSIYPNPGDGEMTVTGEYTSIKIFNSVGQLILEREARERGNKIDLRDHACGLYFVQLQKDNSIQTIRLIKN